MSVKKLSFYLDDADITLRSDQLPVKRFFKNALNTEFNNWVMEIDLGNELNLNNKKHQEH